MRVPDLDVAGRQVVVCGGSPAALGVITDLHAAGAVITVYADAVPTTVRDLADRSLITWHRRTWTESDLAAAALVVPAAADRSENDRIAAAARAAGRLCLAPVEADPDSRRDTGAGVGHVTLVGGGPGDPGSAHGGRPGGGPERGRDHL